MSKIIVHPTSVAQWHALVSDACGAMQKPLATDVESYLVFLLMRFSNKPEILDAIIALDYLHGIHIDKQSTNLLRDVGDQCLLFSGFFPEHAERKHVRVSYFVDIGQAAYSVLAENCLRDHAVLYSQLTESFVALMDVLQTIKQMPNNNADADADADADLSLRQAKDLWIDTGSQRALDVLEKHSNDEIINVIKKFKH